MSRSMDVSVIFKTKIKIKIKIKDKQIDFSFSTFLSYVTVIKDEGENMNTY
jgi:hypothetical protein